MSSSETIEDIFSLTHFLIPITLLLLVVLLLLHVFLQDTLHLFQNIFHILDQPIGHVSLEITIISG